MDREKISFNIGYSTDDKLTFHLRMVSVSEDQEFLGRFADIDDKDPRKNERVYRIHVDALAEFSVAMPTKKEKDPDGKLIDVPLAGDEMSPSDAVKSYFAEMTVEKGWLADYAIRALRSKLQPEVSFL